MKPNRKNLLLAAISLTLTAPSVHAGQTWDGGGVNDNWTSPANWDGNVTASTSSAVNFQGELRTSVNVSLVADTIINGINFTNDGTVGKTAAFNLTGNRVVQNSNITTTASSSTITDTIGIDMIFNASRSINTGLNHNLTITGIISQDATNSNLTKRGAGTLTLSNTTNTFAGQVLSDSGTIQVTKLENNGTASSIGAGIATLRLGFNANATLEYIGTTDSSTDKVFQVGPNAATNTGSATILNNGSGKLTFTAANFNSTAGGAVTVARALTLGGTYTGAANEITGVIQNHNTAGGGTVSLTKEGASTWALSGVNTYTGATNVAGGTLVINGSTSTSIVTVDSGATLGGSGTVEGATTVNGTFAPGQSPGTMTFANTLTLAGSTIMEIDGNSGAGVTGGHDFVNLTGAGVAGTLTYGGTMTLDIGTIFGAGSYSWNLFDFASESGTFTSIALADQYSGSLTDAGGGNWGLTSGDEIWSFSESTGVLGLTIIPEPHAALLSSLGLLALLRRRRY